MQTFEIVNRPNRDIKAVLSDYDGVQEPTDPIRQRLTREILSSMIGVNLPQDECRYLIGISEAQGNQITADRFGRQYRLQLLAAGGVADAKGMNVLGTRTEDLPKIDAEIARLEKLLAPDKHEIYATQVNSFVTSFRQERKRQELEARRSGELVQYPEADLVFQALQHAKMPNGIVTQARQLTLKEHYLHKGMGIASLLSTWITLEMLKPEERKPNPAAYLRGLEIVNDVHGTAIEPAECMTIEDSSPGQKAAEDAGMITVWFDNGTSKITPEQEARVNFKTNSHRGVMNILRTFSSGIRDSATSFLASLAK